MAQLPKGGLVRGHDKAIHGSCAIYFPGGIFFFCVLLRWFLKDDGVMVRGYLRLGVIGANWCILFVTREVGQCSTHDIIGPGIRARKWGQSSDLSRKLMACNEDSRTPAFPPETTQEGTDSPSADGQNPVVVGMVYKSASHDTASTGARYCPSTMQQPLNISKHQSPVFRALSCFFRINILMRFCFQSAR